jgi:uncharacterized membrane protein
MDPSFGVVLLALAFVGSHLGLAIHPIRSRLVARFGELGFRAIFSAVAAIAFSLLAVWYADHRADGPPGLALGASPVLRWPLIAIVALGVVLIVGGFADYTGGPYDLARPGTSRPPRGLERVTRHPFLMGVALFAGAHALLAPHLVGSLLMLSLAVLAVVGARHQDAKLRRLRGAPFVGYLAQTSAVPFGAILAGRQRLAWGELPWGTLLFGVGMAGALRALHAEIFAHHGAWVILGTVGGAGAIGAVSWVLDRRRRPVMLKRPAPSS